MDLIDLHTHSKASDGSLSPGELVALAREQGLAAVALTDHDTVEGLDEALEAGRGLGQEVVPGVEISVEAGLPGGLHLLGLYLDHHDQALQAALTRLQAARAQRNPRMVAKLNQLGVAITMAELTAISGGGQVGRPHFARYLVEKGVVGNSQEAFNRYLAAGKPAYVPKERMDPKEAMAVLRAAGGVPVMAHPGLLKLPRPQLEALIIRFQQMGMEGVEAYYSEHDPTLCQWLIRLAGRLGLVVSGGSDFHGAIKPQVALGRGKGGLAVPASLLGPLTRRRDLVRGS